MIYQASSILIDHSRNKATQYIMHATFAKTGIEMWKIYKQVYKCERSLS